MKGTMWLTVGLGALGLSAAGAWVLQDIATERLGAENAARERAGNGPQRTTGTGVVPALTDSKSGLAHRTTPTSTPGESLRSAYGRFQTGDYEGAIVVLRTELRADPTNAEVRANLSTALLALGLLRVQQQNLTDADAFLDESRKLGNADAERVLASLKLKQGHVDLATSLFEELFDASGDKRSLRMLVDISLRQDDLDRAEYFLARLSDPREGNNGAPAGAPDKERFEKDAEIEGFVSDRRRRLDQKRAFDAASDVIDRGVVEVAYYAPDVRDAAQVVALAIERVYGELTGILGALPAQARLRAWLVSSEGFQVSTGAPPWAGALFDGIIRIPVPRGQLGPAAQAALARIARHEATHAYLFTFCGDTVPSWLGEGLAQRFEGRSPLQAASDLERAMGRAAYRGPTDASLNAAFREAPGESVGRLYAQSLLLVNYLHKNRGGDDLWQKVFRAACHTKLPLNGVLDQELGEATATALWDKFGPEIAGAARN